MEKPLDKERGKSRLQDRRPNLTSCKTLGKEEHCSPKQLSFIFCEIEVGVYNPSGLNLFLHVPAPLAPLQSADTLPSALS